MENVKEASVAGTFYPADTVDLINQIEHIKKSSRTLYKVSTRAIVVPHAALIFSGRLAYEGIAMLNKNIKNLFIIAPAHRVGFEGLALSSFEKWETPLGSIEVNQELCKELSEKYGAAFNDEALAQEHSIEVQVPLVQSAFDDVKIIPVLVGDARADVVLNIIKEYYPNTENGFIISSDLSHFLPDEECRKTDFVTANLIETGNLNDLRFERACGALGVAALVEYANENKFTMIRIGLGNSAQVNNDLSRVVGYGSWFLYEGDKNEFISKYYSNFVIDFCRTVIESSFKEIDTTIVYPQIFDEVGACFVTLKKDGKLRGCIGSPIAYRTLIADLIENTKNAAFKDSRFEPLKTEEFDKIKLEVSFLTAPKRIFFENQEDLLNQIVPNLDGLIIKDGEKEALFLPSVWNEVFDKYDFLTSLKVKAGMEPNYFSNTMEAFRFETISIEEE